jgi:hypothetical protein
MRTFARVAIVAVVCISMCGCGLFKKKEAEAQQSVTLNASIEQSGNQHPASIGTSAAAQFTCVTSVDSQGHTGACYFVGPGYGGIIAPGQGGGTSGPGTVTLNCSNGSGAMRCSGTVRW